MTMPTYEQAMIPVLRVLSTHGATHRREITALVADHLGLTPDERVALLPSGSALVIASRVGWALTYMKQAGLVLSPKRSIYEITERGRLALGDQPAGLNSEYLERFPEFTDFQQRTRGTAKGAQSTSLVVAAQFSDSPEEAFETAYLQLRERTQADLLDAVKSASPTFFEHLVVDLLVRMGYGGSRPDAARAVGRSGDGGIDGVIDEDRLGLDVVYVQAKRWQGTVGRPDIQKFVGALQGRRARKGIFITTSNFSRDAMDYVERIDTRIVLVDGPRLAMLMFDAGIGVGERTTCSVKQVDSDYFEEN